MIGLSQAAPEENSGPISECGDGIKRLLIAAVFSSFQASQT
jgi:hypothetical protein